MQWQGGPPDGFQLSRLATLRGVLMHICQIQRNPNAEAVSGPSSILITQSFVNRAGPGYI